jgi:hypothetical protein
MRTLASHEIQAVSGGDAITDGLAVGFKNRPLIQQVTLVLFYPFAYLAAAYIRAGLGG